MLRRSLAWVLLVALAAGAIPARAEDDAGVLERRVKAAFLYKFASYVDWPAAAFPGADSPMRIGVCGADSLAADLAQLVEGRTAAGHRVAVVRVKPDDDLAGLHILFVGASEIARLPVILSAVPRRPVLVVTDSNGALALGSMINFRLVEGRVRFRIARQAAERHGLRLSSRLLAVAEDVIP